MENDSIRFSLPVSGSEKSELKAVAFSGKTKDLKEIEDLYNRSFPDEERKPFSMILEGIERGASQGWIYYLDEKLAALAFTIPSKQATILDYLAVNKRLQSHGIGSAVLGHLLRICQYPVIVEIEAVDSKKPHTKRRKDFYLRNQLQSTGLTIDLFGVRMELLASTPLVYETYYQVMENYLKFFSRTSSMKLSENLHLIDREN